MPTAAVRRASLMDDRDFVARLEKFDSEAVVSASGGQAGSLNGIDDLDDVWESRATFYEPASARAATRSRMPEPDLEPEFEDDASPLVVQDRHLLRDVAGFLLMMALGAAAAVLVFQARAAQLLPMILRFIPNG
jgi:hypothetical protein